MRFEGVDETHGCATVWTDKGVEVFAVVVAVDGMRRFNNAEQAPGE